MGNYMPVDKKENLLRLQTLLVFLILNRMAKTKLAILSFLCYGEIVKNSNAQKVAVQPFESQQALV